MKVLVLLACLTGLAAAAESKKPSRPNERADVMLAERMLKIELSDAPPVLIEPFLALDSNALPKRLREKTRARQLEIRTYLKLYDTKKKGGVLQAVEACSETSFVKPMKDLPFYREAGWTEEITEFEEDQVSEFTLCREIDLGCHFTLMIFHDAGSKKPRRLFLTGSDPIMMLVARARSKTLGGNYFGTGLSCMH